MKTNLVFVHGRSQQLKDPCALKCEWVEAFRRGLEHAGLDMPIEESDISFPYYGDTLDGLSVGIAPDDLPNIVVRGTKSDGELQFTHLFIDIIRSKLGITDSDIEREVGSETAERGPLNWNWVQGAIRLVDRQSASFGHMSISLFTKDVYEYLTNPIVRTTIDEGVMKTLQSAQSSVVVSHSLGTVVAYNILRKLSYTGSGKIPLFVTIGSPLGIQSIRRQISPIAFPDCIQNWLNYYDTRDIVALYPLESPHFDVNPKISNNCEVNNSTSNRHGIEGYLNDASIAKQIYEALV